MLIVVCDSKYLFILVDIGDIGRQSDGSVYGCKRSHLAHAIENNQLNVLSPTKLPNSKTKKVMPVYFWLTMLLGKIKNPGVICCLQLL